MLQRIKNGLQRFMIGRNGSDTLGWVVLLAGAFFMLLSVLPELEWLYFIAFVCLVYSIFRMYSRNVMKRREENVKFNGFFRTIKMRCSDHEHRFFHCPQCKQTIRVPKGKGRIKIRCPKCQNQFEKKT